MAPNKRKKILFKFADLIKKKYSWIGYSGNNWYG
jgi:hypothetical protein